MISFKFLKIIQSKYNGPIPESDRLKVLFGSVNARFECARAGSMVQHYSAVSSSLIKNIRNLGHDAVAKMQRRFHKQELAHLLGQRRKWKSYSISLGNCPKI